MNTWRVVDPSRIARRGLRALELFAIASLAAGALLWWLIAVRDGIASPAGIVYAAFLAVVLVLPGLLLVHVVRTLHRAATLLVELREQVGEAGLRGEEWGERRPFAGAHAAPRAACEGRGGDRRALVLAARTLGGRRLGPGDPRRRRARPRGAAVAGEFRPTPSAASPHPGSAAGR